MPNSFTFKSGGLSQSAILALIASNAAPLAHKTQHQDGGSDEISITNLLGQHNIPLVNSALGILPVASGWDTAPTSLSNATDGDRSTSTGTGSKVLGAALAIGALSLTLPVTAPHLISLLFGAWSTSNGIKLIIDGADTLAEPGSSGIYLSNRSPNTEKIYCPLPFIINSNILNLYFESTGAGTHNIKFYEIYAFRLT